MSDPDAIRLSVEVDCPREHAFRTWTDKFSTWWPVDHTVSGLAAARVELEPRLGGQIRELLPDGSQHIWGEVTTWEPPELLGYRWHLGRDRSAATDVLIRFVDAPDGRTRIDIEHTGWARQGEDGAIWRARNAGGWQSLLPHLRAALMAEAR
jgi:uncharacterized protein YndB with AHSA1/START domain